MNVYPPPRVVGVTELRAKMSQVLETLVKSEDPIYLTQRGRVVAVLLDAERWERIVDKLCDLEDTVEALEAIDQVRRDPGQVRSWAEARAELEQEEAQQAANA